MRKTFCTTGEVMQRVKRLDPATNETYKTRDNVSLAKLFADVFSDSARYNATAKSWYIYNGNIWEPDAEGLCVEKYAKYLYKALYHYSFEDEDYQKYIRKLGKRTERVQMLLDAREHNFFKREEMDSYPNYLNCQNAVLDLGSFTLLEHDPKYLLGKCTNTEFLPGAESLDFLRFIEEVIPDADKRRYLQKICGLSLTENTSEEECYIIYGATTRNGKSTLLETIGHCLGDYAMSIAPETLAQRKKDGRQASGDLARLDGCRFLRMSEPPKRMIFDVSLLKTLLGRDKIVARNLYEREFEFYPRFTLSINTNYLPTVNDDTLFSSGRIKVITFDRHFEEAEQDKGLKERLQSPENLPGVLNWCLEGLKMYRKEGLLPPQSVIDATREYRENSDKLKLFAEDCLIEDSSSTVTAGAVYDAYASWCRANGYMTEAKRSFMEDLRSHSMLSRTGTIRGNTVYNVVKGYRIETDFAPAENTPFDDLF